MTRDLAPPIAANGDRRISPPKRILALVTDAYGGYGGIARYNQDLLEALAAMPSVEAILTLPRLCIDEPSGLPSRVSQTRPVHAPALYAASAAAAAMRLRPDLIFNGHLYHAPLAELLARMFDARLISQLHGTEVWPPVARRHLGSLKRSDLVLCVSRDTRARYVGQSGTDNAAVLPNTVGPEFCPGDRGAARKSFDVGDAYAILTVARLDTREGYKGHDRVLRALPNIKGPSGRDIVYLIAGAGDDRPRLEALATELGVSSRTRFLGKVPADLLPKLYRAADLFALPSTGEGFGIVFLEAMACGTPAIGLRAGGAPDALADGMLGELVDPDEDFARALQRAINAPPPEPHSLAARVQARFGKPAFFERVHRVFKAIDGTHMTQALGTSTS